MATTVPTSFVAHRINQTDGVSIVAYPYRMTPFPIANVCTEIRWREDTERASVEAEITLHDPDGYLRDMLQPGTWIIIRVIDPITETWSDPPLNLYVWERIAEDRNQAVTKLICFDVISLLYRTAIRPDWVFRKNDSHPKGWTAYEIATNILQYLDVQYRIPETKHYIKYMHLTDASPMEVITAAYTEDRVNSGIRYRIRAVSRWLIIEPLIAQPHTWEIAEGANLLSAEYSESLAGVATEIRAVVVNENSRVQEKSYRAYSTDIGRYGRLTKTIQYTQDQTPDELKRLAHKRLELNRKLGKTASISAEGIPTIRATDAVVVTEAGTGLSGRLFVESVEHTIAAGRHQMSIDLSQVAKVPTRLLSDSEKTPAEQQQEATGPGVIIGPDGRPVQTTASFPELVDIPDDGPDDFVTNFAGVLPNVQAWIKELMAKTPGRQYCISGRRQDPLPYHREGRAMDIAAQGTEKQHGSFTIHDSPQLDFFAKLARMSLGHTDPPRHNPGDLQRPFGPQDGITSNELGTVIWRTRTGGDHYSHVHLDLANASIRPRVPDVTSQPISDVATGTPTQAGSPVTTPSGTVTAAALDNWMRRKVAGNPITGMGQAIINESRKFGIDPRVMTSIFFCETGLGTGGTGRTDNNPGGLSPGVYSAPTMLEGVLDAIRNLGGSLYRGKDTITTIQQSWSPVGASNDPTNLNSNWASCVSQSYAEQGGNGGRVSIFARVKNF